MKQTQVLMIVSLIWLSMTSVAYAGRPLTIDDADPVAKGEAEFEIGLGYQHDAGLRHWDYPAGLTVGVLEALEVGVGFGGQLEQRRLAIEDQAGTGDRDNGVGDPVIAYKWQYIGEGSRLGRQALVPSVKLATADEDRGFGSGETDWDLTWILTHAINELAQMHFNAGYSWIGRAEDQDLSDTAHYGLAFDYQLNEASQLVAEIFAEKERSTGTETLMFYSAGLRYLAIEGLTLDLAAGAGITRDTPDFMATGGLTWAFNTGLIK